MSSRLFRAGAAIDAEPLVWRQVGEAAIARPSGGGALLPPSRANDLEQEIEARIQAAYQQGLAAGQAAARQRAAQVLEPAFNALNRMVQELAGFRPRFRAEAEEDTVKLAIAIARRVLHRELATDPDAILGLVMAAFQKLNARETRRLRVPPADAALLQEHRARLEFPSGLEVSGDPSLPPGSAIFETSRGDLDASVDTQLAEIDRGFADLIRRRAK